MRKKIYIFIMLIIFSFPIIVDASVITYERTEENLQIRDDIVVTDNNLDNILKTPKVNEDEKIYDFADLFTDDEEDKLYDKVNNFIDKHDMDMVIVTIDDNNKSTAKKYADDFYDYNYFGKNNSYDGLIFIIDMDTREIAISTTGSGILMYDDDRVDEILDNAYDEISMKKYYNTALSFINDSNDFANDGLPSSNDNYVIDENGNIVKVKKVNWILTLISSIAIPTIVVIILISKHKGIKIATKADNYVDASKIIRRPNVDTFVNTHTTRIRVPKSSGSSSGGGRIGGSSISRGSSGRSHGGGSRRF